MDDSRKPTLVRLCEITPRLCDFLDADDRRSFAASCWNVLVAMVKHGHLVMRDDGDGNPLLRGTVEKCVAMGDTEALMALFPSDAAVQERYLGETLTSVDASGGNWRSTAHMRQFLTWLATHTVCRRLDYSSNCFGDAGARTIAASQLVKSSRITTLELRSCSIGDAGVQELVAAYLAAGDGGALQVLDLAHNQMQCAGASALASLVQRSQVLQELHLASNLIGDVGAAALGASLGDSASVQVLDLDDNCFGPVGACAVGQGIQRSASVQVVGLSARPSGPDGSCPEGMGFQGAREIAIGLCDSATLRTLRIDGHASMGVQGATAIFRALRVNSALRELSMCRCGVGGSAIDVLAAALRNNCTLQVLDLSGNRIGALGRGAIGLMLYNNTTLRELRFEPGNAEGRASARAVARRIETVAGVLATAAMAVGGLFLFRHVRRAQGRRKYVVYERRGLLVKKNVVVERGFDDET